MSEPQTLQFESARVLATLFANDLTLLKQLETLLDVRVTTREGWLRVEGEPERFEQTKRVFAQLERARQNGVTIGFTSTCHLVCALAHRARWRDLADKLFGQAPARPLRRVTTG